MSTSKKSYENCKETFYKAVKQRSTQKKLSSTQAEQDDVQTEQDSTQIKQSSILMRKIISAISIITFIFIFIEIDGKPIIDFKILCSLMLISSSVIGFFFHNRKHNKPTTVKSKAIHVGIGLLLGGVFVCGILFSVAYFELWQISKESAPQEIENEDQKKLARAERYYNREQYKSAVELYTSNSLLKNPIALNNLGYMYSK